MLSSAVGPGVGAAWRGSVCVLEACWDTFWEGGMCVAGRGGTLACVAGAVDITVYHVCVPQEGAWLFGSL